MHYILALLLLLNITYAKTNDYSIIIDEAFNNALLDVSEDYDRTISAVGFVKAYQSSTMPKGIAYTNAFDYLENLSSSHGPQMHLIKLDKNAKIKLRKSAHMSKFNEAVALVKTPQDGYFVGGYTLDGSLLLLKLNSNGDIILKKEFGTKNYDKMSKLIYLNDGGVLAVGSSTTTRSQNDNIFETGLGLSDIYLARFSKNGEKIWSKKYGTEYDDRGIDAVEAYDGSIIVLSQTRYDKNRDITLMRVSENGNKIWLKHFKNDKDSIAYKLIKLRNNNFVASMSILDDMNKEQIRLIKFDLQKNILRDKTIFTTYSSVIKDIKEYSNSNLIAVGYARDSYNTDGLVILLDSDFGLLKQEHFGQENYDEFNAVSILHNSQAAVVGIHTNENSQESNMWLIKLNRDISIAQLSTKTDDIYKGLSNLFKKEINSKQIKIKEDLSIELVNKDLYFDVSKYKLSEKQKDFLHGFSHKLFKFLKLNQKVINTLEINGHTSSEWANNDFTGSYLNNEKLSLNRAYETLEFMFKLQNNATKEFLSHILKSSGLAYSNKILFSQYEDKKKSRRVSFKVILNNQEN
ncbi:MAG: hypothetical protein COB17_06730 [Sulfurimonas sp.]|nr:MAG: hypothetical protein COB17_06730 [Sulfurimonas sp.]